MDEATVVESLSDLAQLPLLVSDRESLEERWNFQDTAQGVPPAGRRCFGMTSTCSPARKQGSVYSACCFLKIYRKREDGKIKTNKKTLNKKKAP